MHGGTFGVVTWPLCPNQTHGILTKLYWTVYGAQYREFGHGSKLKYIYIYIYTKL